MNKITVYCSECPHVAEISEYRSFYVCPKCGAKTSGTRLREARFRHLTEKQREAICNGCGGKGGFVKPPHAETFERMCNHHDFNYFLGYTWIHKTKADFQLFCALIYEIWLGGMLDGKKWRFPKRLYLSSWSFLYYIAISIFGRRFFYFGEKEQEVPNV